MWWSHSFICFFNTTVWWSASFTWVKQQFTEFCKFCSVFYVHQICISLVVHRIQAKHTNFLKLGNFHAHSEGWGWGHIHVADCAAMSFVFVCCQQIKIKMQISECWGWGHIHVDSERIWKFFHLKVELKKRASSTIKRKLNLWLQLRVKQNWEWRLKTPTWGFGNSCTSLLEMIKHTIACTGTKTSTS